LGLNDEIIPNSVKLNKLLLNLKNKLSNPAISLDEYIKIRLAEGTTKEALKEELLKDLAEGGPIFKDFRKMFKPTFAKSFKRFNNNELEDIKWPLQYIWTSLHSSKYPSCPDCLERDKQLKTWEEWRKIGLPRSGKTRCKKNCKCVLIPEYK